MTHTDQTKTPLAIANWRRAMTAKRKSLEQILEERSIPEPNSGCWLWYGGTNDRGYGTFRHSGRFLYAHRVALSLKIGPLAPGQEACHRCDTPSCINPDHLFVGSHSDNMRDAARKGRLRFVNAPKGETHHSAKLSERAAGEIKRRLAAGESHRALARAFGVCGNSIRNIATRRAWREA